MLNLVGNASMTPELISYYEKSIPNDYDVMHLIDTLGFLSGGVQCAIEKGNGDDVLTLGRLYLLAFYRYQELIRIQLGVEYHKITWQKEFPDVRA